MRATPLLLSSLALLCVAGCATSPDPAQGGFISGLNGLMSGGYDRRVQEQSYNLQQMQIEQAKAEAESRQANATLSAHQQRVAELRGNIAKLDRSLAEARARIARAREANAVLSSQDQQLAAQLESDQSRLARLRERVSAATSAEEYETARKEYLDLRSAIAVLNEQLAGEQH
jgi:chromosome segregation ATPase